jgi:hypothetical protein
MLSILLPPTFKDKKTDKKAKLHEEKTDTTTKQRRSKHIVRNTALARITYAAHSNLLEKLSRTPQQDADMRIPRLPPAPFWSTASAAVYIL